MRIAICRIALVKERKSCLRLFNGVCGIDICSSTSALVILVGRYGVGGLPRSGCFLFVYSLVPCIHIARPE